MANFRDQDLYSILNASKSDTLEDIKSAYRNLAKQHHPDLNNGKISTQWETIQKAYQILIDPEKRKLYDETGYIPAEGSELESAVYSYLKMFIKSWFDKGEGLLQLNIISAIESNCDDQIKNNKNLINAYTLRTNIVLRFQKKLIKKKKYERNRDLMNMIVTEELMEYKVAIMNAYKNIEIFKALKTLVGDYEFDLVKCIQGSEIQI